MEIPSGPFCYYIKPVVRENSLPATEGMTSSFLTPMGLLSRGVNIKGSP